MACVAYAAPIRNQKRRPKDTRDLPYGCYFCADGSCVLFDRRYRPLFRLGHTGRVIRDDPDRWVPDIIAKVWFYTGATRPRINDETWRRVETLMRRWWSASAGAHVALADLLPDDWIVNVKVVGPDDNLPKLY